jgi:hypothetical protein
MNARLAAIVVLPVLLRLHLTVRGAGLSVTIPAAVILIAAMGLAAVALTWLIIRSLQHRTVATWSP